MKLNLTKYFVLILLIFGMFTCNGQTNSITGYVRDSRTWELLADVKVELTAKNPFNTKGFSNVPRALKTDKTGCFTFEGLPEADFELTIYYRFADIGTREIVKFVSTCGEKVTVLEMYLPEKCEFHTSANNTGICPVCKKKDAILKILYGMPNQDLLEKSEKGEVALGGCEIDTYCQAKWRCMRDSIDF
ncbi:MAG: carboxypeptidase-like regulatory domain-containing protein [Aequorivita sp.]